MRETKRSILDIVDENLLDLNRSMLKLSNDQIGNLQNQINIEKKNLEILDQNVNGRLDSVNNNLARKLNEIQNVTNILEPLAKKLVREEAEEAKKRPELKGGSSSRGNVYAMNSSGRKGPVCDDDWGNTDALVVCRYVCRNISHHFISLTQTIL